MVAGRFRLLRCPLCQGAMVAEGGVLRCAAAHAFDIARHGYVNLLPPSGRKGAVHGDTPAMLAARQAFLGAGHYAPLARALVEVILQAFPQTPELTLLDAGCGAGDWLHRIVHGLVAAGRTVTAAGSDLSRDGVRRAARLLPDATMVVANTRLPLPFAPAAFDVLLNLFAPRNPAEFHRLLQRAGLLLVAIPGEGHLDGLRARLPLLPIAADKESRLLAELARFDGVGRRIVRFDLRLSPADARQLVAMTPNAWAVPGPALESLAATPVIETTASFILLAFRPRNDAGPT